LTFHTGEEHKNSRGELVASRKKIIADCVCQCSKLCYETELDTIFKNFNALANHLPSKLIFKRLFRNITSTKVFQ